jgi:tetratricopeptide (TPR) repeat protein
MILSGAGAGVGGCYLTVDTLLQEAGALRSRGAFQAAVDVYDVALDVIGRGDSQVVHECRSMRERTATAWNGKGDALCGVMRFHEALKAYAQALDADPTCAAAWESRVNLLAMWA